MASLIVQQDRIAENYNTFVRLCSGVPVIAVLKGNGYGLGDVAIAKLLYAEGARFFAVSRLEEAERLLREIKGIDVLLMTPYIDEESVSRVVACGVIATVSSYESAVVLNGMAEKAGKQVAAHLKFDTGMGRFGFMPGDIDKAVQVCRYMKNIRVTGAFTHLSFCFGKKKKISFRQFEQFRSIVNQLKREGVEIPLCHISNTAAALLYPEMRMGAVRIGSGLLGRIAVRDRWGLKRVGRLVDEICEVRWLPKGHNIGYGNTYKTRKPIKIAVVPLGTADGLFLERRPDAFRFSDMLRMGLRGLRLLLPSAKLGCEVGGKRARVLGRIGLTSVVIDVTEIDCSPGDLVSFDTNPLFVNCSVRREYV